MLRIENLGVRFGQNEIFSDISLHVGRGETVCLTGQSGCGKTTLLKSVMGFVIPFQGTVAVDNTLLTPQTTHIIRRKIAWMPQGLSLPCEWVGEMVHLPLDLKANRGTPFDKNTLLAHFEALGLEENLLGKRLHEISGGQYQRILLAVTAMQEKPLIIIDEPTSALDKAATQKAIRFVHNLAAEGRAILAVSHDSDFMNGCDKQFIIHNSQ